jgi:acyl-CoA dehydrogenase
MRENMVLDTATRIFADLADPQTVNRAKDDGWKAQTWQALEDSGLTLAWVPEELGGAAAGLEDGFEILTAAGRFAAAVPLAETMLAGWLLSQAGIAPPRGMMAVLPMRPGERISCNSDRTLSGHARNVPFAREARHFAVYAESKGALSIGVVEAELCRITRGQNLAGEPYDAVTLDRVKPLHLGKAPIGLDQTSLMVVGSIARSMQAAGALETVLALSLQYANERVAFDGPIAKFQVIQHGLARLAGEVAAAMVAARSAAQALAQHDETDALFLEAASAKIRCTEASEKASAIAHQIHGAIGFTKEHVLHRFTLRLLSWRDDFGDECHWATELGSRMAARGAEQLWPLLASR